MIIVLVWASGEGRAEGKISLNQSLLAHLNCEIMP